MNDDKVVNAAASYGNVLVFTGILPVAKDEEGLAAVLGHGESPLLMIRNATEAH